MISDATSAGLGGFNAAARKLETSAHNVAQVAIQSGGPPDTAVGVQAGERPLAAKDPNTKTPPVDLAKEAVDQVRAQVAAEASLRVVEEDLELKGKLVDLKA